MASSNQPSIFNQFIQWMRSFFKSLWKALSSFFRKTSPLATNSQLTTHKPKNAPILKTPISPVSKNSINTQTTLPVIPQDNKPIPLSPRLLELREKQRETYQEIFLKHPSDCHEPLYHYDWWMFPVEAPSNVSATSKYYSVNNQDVKALLHHQAFISTYVETLTKYLGNLKEYGWNRYEVRYAKMLSSLNKFLSCSEKLSSGKAIQPIEDNLKLLAKEAISFAKENISTNNTFLQKELTNLTKTLENKNRKPNI